MSKSKLFGIPITEIRRQCRVPSLEPDLTATPISNNEETLDPCIRGAHKISSDSHLREMVKEILTS